MILIIFRLIFIIKQDVSNYHKINNFNKIKNASKFKYFLIIFNSKKAPK